MLRTPPQELQSNLMTLHILLAQDRKVLPLLSTEEQNTLPFLSAKDQKALPCQVYQYQTHLYTVAIAVVRRDFLVVLTHTVYQTHLYTAAIAVVRRDFLVVLTHTVYQTHLYTAAIAVVRRDFLVALTHTVYIPVHDNKRQTATHRGSLLVQNNSSRTGNPYSKPIT